MSIVRRMVEAQQEYNRILSMQVEALTLSPKSPYVAYPKRHGWRPMVRSWAWALTGWMWKWDGRFRSRYLDRGGCLIERCTAQEFYQ